MLIRGVSIVVDMLVQCLLAKWSGIQAPLCGLLTGKRSSAALGCLDASKNTICPDAEKGGIKTNNPFGTGDTEASKGSSGHNRSGYHQMTAKILRCDKDA